jgi:hypothetical protein
MQDATPAPASIADDLLVGAPAIARFLGWPQRRVYHVIEAGSRWPIWKDDGGIMARKSKLLAYIEEREREAANRSHAA